MKDKSFPKRAWRATDCFVRKVAPLNALIGEWIFEQRWKTEFALLKNKDISSSTHPSIVHMGLNRSASQWVKSVLRRVGATIGLLHVRWNEMAFDSSYPFLDHLDTVEKYQHIFRPRGYLYSAFGGYPTGIPDFSAYKAVLVVRDPRDILVSRYYSKAVSHRLPFEGSNKRDRVVQERKQAQKQSIDAFVRNESDKLLKTYNAYLDGLLRDHPDVHIARYEDMTADVEVWLSDLLEYVEIDPPQDLKEEIIAEARAVQDRKREDKTAHVRKGKPGDHVGKLNSESIYHLNQKFSRVLSHFGYRD